VQIDRLDQAPIDPTTSPAVVPSPQKEPAMQLTVFEPTTVLDDLPCRSVDPELFFAESPADVELAKAVCTDCPIREACLKGALERKEPWGVWGGELLMSGAIVPGKRPRGRPRKDAVAFGTSSRAAAGDLAQAG
jgi:WhiB family transcriptional regulator, redox-sensing transcriptional regulator